MMELAVCVRVEGDDKLWVVLDFCNENKEKGKDFGLEEMKAVVLEDEIRIFSQGLKR